MIKTSTGNSLNIIENLIKYMESEGLVFKKKNLSDSSPYAILLNGTSIGYRSRSKWNKTGIVFFCSSDKIDANNLSQDLNLPIDDNSTDSARPYAVFIPNTKVDQAVQILKKNPDNMLHKSGSFDMPNKSETSSKNYYINKYRDAYFPFVSKCLIRDGYSGSDSNTATTVSDTFYLERQDSTDFMYWFESPENFEQAKRRLVELLTAANRKNSSLKNDIKYYTRDITYFAEFLRQNSMNGSAFKQTKNASQDDFFSKARIPTKYSIVKSLNDRGNVVLVRNSEDGSLYVKKKYYVFNKDVFERLKNEKIDGLPEIIEINLEDDTLYTVEEYIEGNTLLEMIENRVFNEAETKYVMLQLCKIVEKMHSMNPPVLHRDIKPSNIIMTRNGKVYLIDFNASKENTGNKTEDTMLYGTKYFGAPEQITGYMKSSEATDVFGMGATMNVLLTGLHHTEMKAPGKFRNIIDKCTKMDPNDRYQTVRELEEAILSL